MPRMLANGVQGPQCCTQHFDFWGICSPLFQVVARFSCGASWMHRASGKPWGTSSDIVARKQIALRLRRPQHNSNLTLNTAQQLCLAHRPQNVLRLTHMDTKCTFDPQSKAAALERENEFDALTTSSLANRRLSATPESVPWICLSNTWKSFRQTPRLRHG